MKDKNNLKDFVAAYSQMNRWVPIKAGGKMLIIGADNYPFPIPLGRIPSDSGSSTRQQVRTRFWRAASAKMN